MTVYLLAAMAVVTALAGLWGAFEHQRTLTYQARAQTAVEAAGRLQATVAAQRRDAEAKARVSAALADQINQLRRDAESRQRALNEAFKQAPDWAAAPIPSGVYDALTGAASAPVPAGPRVDRRGPGAPAPRTNER